MKSEFLLEAPVNTQGNLNVDRIGAMRIPFPPIDEQKNIVKWIETETVSLSKPKARTEHEIGLLHEYRTRLIADVVTGKLDVRTAAARLPDEQPEQLDPIPVGEEVDVDADELAHG